MLKTPYRYELRTRDKLMLVRLFGEIDHHSAAMLRAQLDEKILTARPLRLVMDLAAIEFMDSAGLGFLMGRYRLMRELGGELALVAPNARVWKILHLAGMDRFMEIEESNGGRRK